MKTVRGSRADTSSDVLANALLSIEIVSFSRWEIRKTIHCNWSAKIYLLTYLESFRCLSSVWGGEGKRIKAEVSFQVSPPYFLLVSSWPQNSAPLNPSSWPLEDGVTTICRGDGAKFSSRWEPPLLLFANLAKGAADGGRALIGCWSAFRIAASTRDSFLRCFLKYEWRLFVQPPTPRMWSQISSGLSGAEEIVNGCHSKLAISGMFTNM